MELKWIDILLILLGLFIAYQIITKLLGGSWQTESIIISLLIFNLGVTYRLSIKIDGHINWHKMKGKRGAFELEVLGKWIIGVAILVIIMVGYFILSGKGESILGYIENLFRFG